MRVNDQASTVAVRFIHMSRAFNVEDPFEGWDLGRGRIYRGAQNDRTNAVLEEELKSIFDCNIKRFTVRRRYCCQSCNVLKEGDVEIIGVDGTVKEIGSAEMKCGRRSGNKCEVRCWRRRACEHTVQKFRDGSMAMSCVERSKRSS